MRLHERVPKPRAHQAMGPGHEFDTIRMLMARWGDLAVDIGDDAAVLSPEIHGRTRVISTDACIEGAHFLHEWISPFDVGVRAAAGVQSPRDDLHESRPAFGNLLEPLHDGLVSAHRDFVIASCVAKAAEEAAGGRKPCRC